MKIEGGLGELMKIMGGLIDWLSSRGEMVFRTLQPACYAAFNA